MPLQGVKPRCLSENEPLSRHSSFKIGGLARYFAQPPTVEDLLETIEFSRNEGLPWRVIGGGCNVLFGDDGFSGTIISMSQFIDPPSRAVEEKLYVPAGLSIPRLGRICRENGLSGLEFLSQIPGTVGGAVAMNAGFSRTGDRNQCVSPFVDQVQVISHEGEIRTIGRNELLFRYRWSNLQDYVIVAVTLLLNRGSPDEIAAEMRKNYQYRISVQDLRYPSAGSIFKNPENNSLTVGKMVQNLGLRGKRIGDAQISELHGNWIINLGHACASEVLELIFLIKEKVFRDYGIALELELKTIGMST